MNILPNISISNDALDKGMVRRPDPEEYGPERGRNPCEYVSEVVRKANITY